MNSIIICHNHVLGIVLTIRVLDTIISVFFQIILGELHEIVNEHISPGNEGCRHGYDH